MSIRLPSVRIANYRQLRSLEVDELGHVNLIVGGNNTGKSTFLEAIRLLAGRGSPTLVEDILVQHGEYQMPSGDLGGDPIAERAISSFFYGRSFPAKDGDSIYIGDKAGHLSVQFEHVFLREELEEREVDGEKVVTRRLKKVAKSDRESIAEAIEAIETSVSDGGGLFAAPIRSLAVPLMDFFGNRRPSRFRFEESSPPIPLSFVPARFVARESLAESWDEVVLTDGEEYAINALRLIEPSTKGLAFVQQARSGRPNRLVPSRPEDRFAVVKLGSATTPVPLQSMGDGMTRVLQLVLSALRARGGFLLVDEIENGLHYTVQVHVWRLLFLLAKRNGTQVFATTHSADCVRAFSSVAAEDALQGKLIHMERNIENGETEVSIVREQELLDLVGSGIEVR